MSGKVTWHFHSHGEREDYPILFLHGFMADGSIWLPTMQNLPEKVHCIAVDLPGHGKTECDLSWLDFDSLAQSLADFAASHFEREPLMIGYSMGGRIALYTALRYPEKFSGLVLESCTPGIEDDDERLRRFESDRGLAMKLRQGNMRSFLADWYRQPVFASLRAEVVEEIIGRKSKENPYKLAEVLVRLSQGAQPPLWRKLPGWRRPTLIVAGDKDSKHVAIARKMGAIMPTAHVQIISGAGHIVHLENNKDFVSALNFFLGSYIL
jgi:2-succinyl-6-hydroxy-2,4-cyclohexadiene-1-carboxylate synthase